ncbi:MAG TPA: CheB methylesterase domain-containing protein, partial [Gemmatimonadales bacterium]|nr:CheB methylesterase domain-containing protein [Gemmatimonadales bacterium]
RAAPPAAPRPAPPCPATPAPARPGPQDARVEVVCVGVSTGGPNALAALLPALPADFPVPVLIVQHMPPLFTKLLADRLSTQSRIPVREASGGEPLTPGTAWLAPGDRHLVVVPDTDGPRLRLTLDPPENSCRPAVDVLFRSVAAVFGGRALGVILTGMGQDGLRGSEEIRRAGGRILAQDQATSVVWGMPGFVASAGLADRVLPLDQIAPEIVRRVGELRPLAGHGVRA